MGALAEILKPILVPIIAQVFKDLIVLYKSDPKFREEVDGAIANLEKAQTDEERKGATKALLDNARK